MTTERDAIMEEIYRERDEHAARFNYDLEAIWRDLKERERRSDRPRVSLADRKRSQPK
ncbi:MAG TPA: hypothetical protein VFJ82_16840 [Longimicrobium sp.]|nr:hypothetical protein [Longimicrobium sp.]